MTTELKQWRTQRLGVAKRMPRYKSLSPFAKQVVDKLVRMHESEAEGITVKQENIGKLFGIGRQATNKVMREIVDAGVFTSERRGRPGRHGGQTSNRYRLNLGVESPLESRLESPPNHLHGDSEGDTQDDTQGDSGSSSYRTTIEVPWVQRKSLSGETGEAASQHPPSSDF